MAYLKLHRLHTERLLLLAADLKDVSIHYMAVEGGFLNPGHFARDYCLLIRERPSDTPGCVASPPPHRSGISGDMAS
jgi:AraC family ethanolamine operon transcriptional activator